MALITDWSNNRFGVPAPQSYTRITEISVKRRTTFATPPEPGQPSPGVLATHVVQFRTETYLNKDLALGGGSPIEEHGYTFFPNWENTDATALCYNWLKENISQFKNAING
jgi:hypothetical protein